MNRICTIPFSGFYESTHSETLDYTLEQICSDENGDVDDAKHDAACDEIDWRKVHLAYAQEYAENLISECGIQGAAFVKLDSPREYNFRSDEIDISIPLAELQRMRGAVDDATLRAMVADRLAPRSGFAPFYSDDLDDWGNIDEWEAPQLSILVECYCDMYCDAETRDCWLVDDCNGAITAMIENALPADVLGVIYA